MCQPGEALGCPPSALGTRPVCARLTSSAREDPLDKEAAGVRRVTLGPWKQDHRDDKGAGGSLEPSGPLSGSLCWTWGPPSLGPHFSWSSKGPAADRPPPCPVGTVGVHPPPRASGLWKWVSLAPGCWQPGGPHGVTPGARHLHGQGPWGREPAGPGSHACSAALFTVGSSPHCVCADTTDRLTQEVVHRPRTKPRRAVVILVST